MWNIFEFSFVSFYQSNEKATIIFCSAQFSCLVRVLKCNIRWLLFFSPRNSAMPLPLLLLLILMFSRAHENGKEIQKSETKREEK